MKKSIRHAKILELIKDKEIETQEELCSQLTELGFTATQATISRDINELHLYKVAGVEKKYRYISIETNNNVVSAKMKNLFKECVVSISRANNLVVVRTLSGNGSNAGMVVDKLIHPQILGSIAGDDTLLIVSDNDDSAKKIVDTLNDLLK